MNNLELQPGEASDDTVIGLADNENDTSGGEPEQTSFNHEAIEELVSPIRNLLEKVHHHIDSGEYKLLIGGDASGRIPALIFTKVIREIYKKKGFEVPRTLTTFIAGGERYNGHHDEGLNDNGPNEKRKEIVDYINKHYVGENLKLRDFPIVDRVKPPVVGDYVPHFKGRVLIIDDTIASGESIKPVTDALSSMGISYDFVSIGDFTDNLTDLSQLENKLGAKIYTAIDGVPEIYSRGEIAGVFKNKGDLFSEPNVTGRTPVAREDVDLVAKELTEWYLAKF